MAGYIPPVNLPSLGGKDYARDLYGMVSGVGEAYYGAKRDTIGDQQWQSEQDRMTAAQALAQSNADRNYALELRRFEADQAETAAGPKFYGSAQWYQRDDGSMGFGVLGTDGSFKDIPAPEGSKWAPPAVTDDYGGKKEVRDKFGNVIRSTPVTGDVGTDMTVTEFDPATGEPLAVAPRPGSQPAMDQATAQRERTQTQNAARIAIHTIEGRTQMVDGFIDQAIEKVGPWTTGWGGVLANLPETEARALGNDLLTIKSNLGLDEIRNLKASGATLGQVTEFENRMLQAINGALDQLGRGEDMRATLQEVKRWRAATVAAARIGYLADYGGLPPDIAAGAFDALAAGKDPRAVVQRAQEMAGGR